MENKAKEILMMKAQTHPGYMEQEPLNHLERFIRDRKDALETLNKEFQAKAKAKEIKAKAEADALKDFLILHPLDAEQLTRPSAWYESDINNYVNNLSCCHYMTYSHITRSMSNYHDAVYDRESEILGGVPGRLLDLKF